MFWFAQFIGFIGVIVNIISIQMKEKKNILFFFAMSNFLFAVNFVSLNSYTGGVICFIAGIQTIISYLHKKRDRAFPKTLIPVYIVISLAAGIISYRAYIDILPIICSVLFTFSIIQSKEKHIRLLTFINVLLWIAYDFVSKAYVAGANDIFFTISTFVAILRYDVKKNQNGTAA